MPPLLMGVSDGVTDQVTQFPQAVKLAFDLATKSEVRQGIWDAVKNITPGSVCALAEKSIKEKIEKYNFDDKPYLGYHELGKDGVNVVNLASAGVTFIAKGRGALENGVKQTGEKFFKEIDPELNRIWKLSAQKLGKPHSSQVLGNNLKAVGKERPSNSAAHHIVAGGEKYTNARLSRKILDDAEIDINEAANGVFLPKESKYVIGDAVAHTKVHTNRYYDALYGRLKDIQKDKIRNELKKISDELLNGTFPY